MFDIIGAANDKEKVLVQVDISTLANLVSGFGCSNLNNRRDIAKTYLNVTSYDFMRCYHEFLDIKDKLKKYLEDNNLGRE